MEDDDAALVQRARAGDGQAFAELFERFVDEVYDFAWRVLRQPAAADQVTRDTFVRAARSLAGIPDPATFPTWLLAIAYHLAMERLDRAAVRPAPPLEGDPTRTEDQAILAAGRDLPALVWDAAAGLDRRHYALLDLTTRHGFLPADVASMLGVPPARGAELVGRVHRAVDDALTAYVAARRERDNCEGLAAIVPPGPIKVFPPDMRRQVSEHLRSDPGCRAAIEALPTPRQVLAALEPLPVPGDLRDSLSAYLPEMFTAGAAGIAGAMGGVAAAGTVAAAAAADAATPAAAGVPLPPEDAGGAVEEEQPEGEAPPEQEADATAAGATAPVAAAAAAAAGATPPSDEDALSALLQPDLVRAGIRPPGPPPLDRPRGTLRPAPWGDSGVPPLRPAAPAGAGGGFWEYLQQHWTVLGAGAIFGIGLVIMGVALVVTAFGGGGGGGAAKATATASITATARPTQSPTASTTATQTPLATATEEPPTETPAPPTATMPPAETPTIAALTATPTSAPPVKSPTPGPPVSTAVIPPTTTP